MTKNKTVKTDRNNDSACPLCRSENIREIAQREEFSVRGADPYMVDDYLSTVCDDCGASYTSPRQNKINDALCADAKRARDGLLTGQQIRAVRKLRNLRQEDASRLFGGGPNAFSKYERGEVIQSASMDRLLRLVADSDDAFSRLKRYAGIAIADKPDVFDGLAQKREAGATFWVVYQGAIEASADVSSLVAGQSIRKRSRRDERLVGASVEPELKYAS